MDFFFPNSVYFGHPINVMCEAVLSLVVSLFVWSGSLQLYIAQCSVCSIHCVTVLYCTVKSCILLRNQAKQTVRYGTQKRCLMPWMLINQQCELPKKQNNKQQQCYTESAPEKVTSPFPPFRPFGFSIQFVKFFWITHGICYVNFKGMRMTLHSFNIGKRIFTRNERCASLLNI